MAITYTKYITKQDETWTSIAFKAYGHAGEIVIDGNKVGAIAAIYKANPNVPCKDTFQANITIFVPIQDTPTKTASAGNQPPWRR
jgi:phage tail protein X